jgi:hypothetical protein
VADVTGGVVTLTALDEIGGGEPTQAVDTLGALEVASTSLDVSTTGTGATHHGGGCHHGGLYHGRSDGW